MWEDGGFLYLIWSEYWWLSFHGAQTGKPTFCTDCCVSASPGRSCPVLSCRWGQDKMWIRLQPISVLLSCQNATCNKPESQIYVFTPNSPPVQHTTWNYWHLVLLGGSWRESSEQGSRNRCGLVPDLGQITPFRSSVFPSVKLCCLHFLITSFVHVGTRWFWVSTYKHHNGTIHFQQVQAEPQASSRCLPIPQTKRHV